MINYKGKYMILFPAKWQIPYLTIRVRLSLWSAADISPPCQSSSNEAVHLNWFPTAPKATKTALYDIVNIIIHIKVLHTDWVVEIWEAHCCSKDLMRASFSVLIASCFLFNSSMSSVALVFSISISFRNWSRSYSI